MSIIKRVILNNDDDVKWFQETYPNGSYSWLFTMLLSKFREVTTEKGTPQDLAILGAESLKEEIDG